VARLSRAGAERDAAVVELHDLLLRAARFEIRRRRAVFPHLGGADLDDLAWQSADDALMSILRRLRDFRGDSRFTTWACKFAIVEAGAKVRRHAWLGREIPLTPAFGALVADTGPLDSYVELEMAGVAAEAEMPLMRAHLRGCSACRDDHDSLLALVRAEGGPDRGRT
jgi:RNA polymerase sigma-70 factor (ECF subfamily)